MQLTLASHNSLGVSWRQTPSEAVVRGLLHCAAERDHADGHQVDRIRDPGREAVPTDVAHRHEQHCCQRHQDSWVVCRKNEYTVAGSLLLIV